VNPVEEPIVPWVRQNALNIVIGAAILGLILWKLHPLDVVLAAAGLTLIIFLHELGHFTAAKLCKVRVETFSIGFGPAIPFCSCKYGETTYKLAIIPLGGFVKMLGEGENAEGEEAENDPRSFKNQSVPERMLIISAGVIMNLILAFALFVVVYMHGLEEQPAVVATVEPGGALWRQGIHTGTVIESINGRTGLFFEDVRPMVWNTNAGEKLDITYEYAGKTGSISAEPRQEEGAPFPLLGFAPPTSMKLYTHPRDPSPPYRRGSAAEQAIGSGDARFMPGDDIVGMTDPDSKQVTPLAVPEGSFACFDFERRMARLAGQPVMMQVRRKDAPPEQPLIVLSLPAENRYETGLRMRMGPIVAVRDGSPAARAGLRGKDGANDGDRIVELEITDADGAITLYAADVNDANAQRKNASKPKVIALDPLRLPWLLHIWSLAPGEKKVKLTVLRSVEHSEKRVTFDLTWDSVGAGDLGEGGSPTAPVAINGLGLGYSVQAVIDGVQPGSSAAAGGIQAGDAVEAVKFHTIDEDGQEKIGKWDDTKPGLWAFVDRVMQVNGPHIIDVRVNRNGTKIEATLTGTADPSCPVIDRGLIFLPEFRIQKAGDVGEALNMGVHRTVRMIKNMYINLYAMAFGRVSAVQTMSGPITLARLSYKIAGESNYKLLLLLALISINLAVVNFLPIPMLDGGHMMFLIYEGIVGRPPPDRVHFWLSMLGLAMVLSLMVFVIGLDLWRLAKMWFGW
jgi:regulator of sigma E protease